MDLARESHARPTNALTKIFAEASSVRASARLSLGCTLSLAT